MGNHEYRTFYTSNNPENPWHLEGDDDLREEIFNVLKKLIKQGKITACDIIKTKKENDEFKGKNIFSAHSVASLEHFDELREELDKPSSSTNPKLFEEINENRKKRELDIFKQQDIIDAFDYFITKTRQVYDNLEAYTIYEIYYAGQTVKVVDISELYQGEENIYNQNQLLIVDYINEIFRTYLPDAEFSIYKGKDEEEPWEDLVKKSVLFKYMADGEDGGQAVPSLFHARPNIPLEDRKEVRYSTNSVIPILWYSISGHHHIQNEAGRAMVFFLKRNLTARGGNNVISFICLNIICADGGGANLIIKKNGDIERISSEPLITLNQITETLLTDRTAVFYDEKKDQFLFKTGMTVITFAELVAQIKKEFFELTLKKENIDIDPKIMENHKDKFNNKEHVLNLYKSMLGNPDTQSLKNYKAHLFYPENAIFRYNLNNMDEIKELLANIRICFEKDKKVEKDPYLITSNFLEKIMHTERPLDNLKKEDQIAEIDKLDKRLKERLLQELRIIFKKKNYSRYEI